MYDWFIERLQQFTIDQSDRNVEKYNILIENDKMYYKDKVVHVDNVVKFLTSTCVQLFMSLLLRLRTFNILVTIANYSFC